MKSLANRCINQILNSIYPGPCKSRLYESISKKLVKNFQAKGLIIMKFQSNIDSMLVKHLTCSNKVVVQAVDCVHTLLVAEPITVLQDINDSLVHPPKKEMMNEYLTATELFLKYRYSQHVTVTTDNWVTHNLKYILG